jgi:lysophospholipase L1-like esterase
MIGLFAGLFLILNFNVLEAKKKKQSRKKISKKQFNLAKATKIQFVELENPDSPEFVTFLKKLNGLKSESHNQARLFIIGDSHMQCEDFGAALRNYLIDTLKIPYAGRGFTFPYPLARTSQRSDMFFGPNQDWHGCRFTKVGNDCEWGMAGWTAHFNRDSTVFSWRMGHSEFVQGDDIQLFCPPKNAYAYRLLMYDSTGRNQSLFYNPKTFAFEGKVLRTTQKLFFDLKRNEPGAEFVHQGFLLKPQKSGFVCGISGTNGARLDHYLQSPDFQKHISQMNPDLVILCLGTNDVYANDFDVEGSRTFLYGLLSKIKAAVPTSAILLVGPPDHCIGRKKANPKTEKINKIFSETADELDFVFWNQQKAMGGKGSIFQWRRNKWATKDMVHFEPGGYKKQANLLGWAIKTQFTKTQ